jgi:arylsulfatase A-like enzyme
MKESNLRHKRELFFLGIVLVVIGFVLFHMVRRVAIPAIASSERPNILLISIDTLRPDHLGCYGYTRPTSPSIDDLAWRGVLFENAYSHSPVTALSHMSIFTSLYPPAHGVNQWSETGAHRLSESIPTMATLLRKKGYRTFGVAGGGHVRGELGFDQGMDHYQHIGPIEKAFRKAFELITSSTKKETPFFMFLHTYAVHDPYTPPDPYAIRFIRNHYRGKIIRSGRELNRLAGKEWHQKSKLFWDLVDEKSPQDLQHLKDLYDASIREADDQVGVLLMRLRKMGVLKNTMIVFLSDHGEEFLEHGQFVHKQIYQELLHVPLIILFPENYNLQFQNRREPALVRLVDVLPTVLDVARVPHPKGIHGVSLLPLLTDKIAPPREVISNWAHLSAIRHEDQKLILKENSPLEKELYFLHEDPAEKRDLNELQPEITSNLQERLNHLFSQSLAFRQKNEEGKRVLPDEETIENLKALGYLNE